MRDRFSSSFVFALILVSGGPEVFGGDARSREGQVGRPDLVLISPGTLTESRPPKSWSHLVIKSLPHLASGDLQTLPRSSFRTATLIRTVILADIVRSTDNPARFVLKRVGIGLCIPNKAGRDVVVTSGRLAEIGISLGMIERMVLKSAEAELSRGRLVAATPTFALFRTPAVLREGREHHKVNVFYALLVDANSGALRTLVWAQNVRRAGALTSQGVVELEPDLVYDCPLDVMAERVLGTVPVSWSFAMEDLPPGQSRHLAPDLLRFLSLATSGTPDPQVLERALRSAVNGKETVGLTSSRP
jgi:hypothetical protein